MASIAPDQSSQRPTKRRRDEIDDQLALAETLEVNKSTRFWFPGGTVVIQAENIQFKVHWDILAARSNIFKDLFDLPQASTERRVDGCPLVNVHDLAEDWTILLEVVYCSSPIGSSKRDLAFYASLIRLGRKYEFADFADASLDHLLSVFSDIHSLRGSGLITGLTRASIYKLATVAEELGIQILLPPLYLAAITSLTLLEISDGLCVEGVPTLKLPTMFRQELLAHRDAFTDELKSMCHSALAPGRFPPGLPLRSCTTQASCALAFEKKRQFIVHNDIASNLSSLDDFVDTCHECRQHASSFVQAEFRDFYACDMIFLFGLPYDDLARFSD